MPQTTALDSLIEFARGQRDDALSRFAASITQTRAAKERLSLLLGYRDDYAARLAAMARGGLTVGQLRNFRLFLDKLDLAIRQQQQAASSHTEHSAGQRANWTHSETRLLGYSSLLDRRRASDRLRLRRDEQRGTDEHASRVCAARSKEEI